MYVICAALSLGRSDVVPYQGRLWFVEYGYNIRLQSMYLYNLYPYFHCVVSGILCLPLTSVDCVMEVTDSSVVRASVSGTWNKLSMIWRSWIWTLVRLNSVCVVLSHTWTKTYTRNFLYHKAYWFTLIRYTNKAADEYNVIMHECNT